MKKVYFGFWVILSISYLYVLLIGVPWTSQPSAPGTLINPFSGFWQNAESVHKHPDINIKSPSLKSPVDVYFDERMVPHLYANHVEDHAFALGYLHARFRLWQMDIAVRATSGRLAEVLGRDLVENDRIQRRKGLGDVARNFVDFWKKDSDAFNFLTSYMNGVNTFIDQLSPAEYPLEFKLLAYKPEHWTAEHTAYMAISMAETLAQNSQDAQRNNIRLKYGDSVYYHFFAEFSERSSPVIPDGSYTFGTAGVVDTSASFLYRHLTPSIPHYVEPETGLGSNSWALAASKTKDGFPLLANDPHLRLSLPSIWFECQLKSPEFHAHGVSIPGVPGIIIGFNEYHAWGITNVGHDVLDWYAIQWEDEERTKYTVDGESHSVTWKREEIKVRGLQTVIDSVRYTRWGPVVYEGDDDFRQGLAMRWLAHEPKTGNDFENYLRVMKGNSYMDFREGFEANEIPANNYVYASVADTIAMLVAGKFPLRANDEATRIRDGSDSREDWKGFIPLDSIPEMINPERNFVSSANQRSTGDDYPYAYSGFFYFFRGNYMNRLLTDKEQATIEDMQNMQLDNYSIFPEEALPVMLQLTDQTALSENQLYWLDLTSNWNYRFDPELIQPTIFLRWWDYLKELIWDEFQTKKDEPAMLIPTDWRTIDFLTHEQDHPFWNRMDTDSLETASDIVTLAFKKTIDELAGQLEDSNFSYQQFKSFSINHAGRIPAFGSPVLNVGGHQHALNSIRDAVGPSWRMVVTLDPAGPHATVVYPGGQSGNPGSYFYDNMLKYWETGQYYQVRLFDTPEAIETNIATYQFTPN